MDPGCEFCQIVRGELPARVVADTADALAFFPLRPVCPAHTLVIPKRHVRDLWAELPAGLLALARCVYGHSKPERRR